ncbi:unnamed protein product, partial [Vitis vinifera]
MKRRIFQTSSTAPLHIPTGLQGPQDISRVKRGKFMDRENAHPPSCRADADASSIPIGGTQGTQCIDEEAFSRKRQKLRQWVDTSFPEIDALYSKGYDFISVLLSRLSPKTSENKVCSFNFHWILILFWSLIIVLKTNFFSRVLRVKRCSQMDDASLKLLHF